MSLESDTARREGNKMAANQAFGANLRGTIVLHDRNSHPTPLTIFHWDMSHAYPEPSVILHKER